MNQLWRIVGLIVVTACGNKAAPPAPTTATPSGSGSGSAAATVAPKLVASPAVKVRSVLATDDAPPPVIVLLDAKGDLTVAAAATWSDVAAAKWAAGPKAAPLDVIARFTAETRMLHTAPVQAVAKLDVTRNDDLVAKATPDDPPPPEPEHADDSDESGGTGTAMALDEGKMGKQGSADLDRQAAIDAARNAGDLGSKALHAADTNGKEQGDARRQARIHGLVTDDKLGDVPAVVLADPAAKAAAVVHVVSETRAMIGVQNGADVRPLRLQFHRRDQNGIGFDHEPGDWLEVRVDAAGLTVEAVPSKTATVAWADAAGKLAGAIADARTRSHYDAAAPVDVLVGADVDAQHLVDVLVALDAAGVKAIGLGETPTGEQLALRGHEPTPKPRMVLGQPNVQGELDKAVVRRFVKRSEPKLQACYEKAVLAKPELKGTVMVQFFIAPSGKVKEAVASGVDPEVATCVSDVIRGIEFPKPKTGGVQANYPLTFTMR